MSGFDDNTNPAPVCQYWAVDEPVQCKWWDEDTTICTFQEIDQKTKKVNHALFYPYCNLIGTQIKCDHYERNNSVIDVSGGGDSSTSNSVPRCILPDPGRHTCRLSTGNKWVYRVSPEVYDESGNLTSPAVWSFSDINGYDNGRCNNKGTETTCSGYSPFHMSFGKIRPQTYEEYLSDTIDTNPDEETKTCVYGGYRLPLEYAILNRRADISPCLWWEGSPAKYTLGTINDFTSSCSYPTKSEVEPHRSGINPDYPFQFKCNGASSDCPRYTGVCWQYCIDPKMDPGDKVLAEQIHELRYYLRREKWNSIIYNNIFPEDGNIYTWEGTLSQVRDQFGNITYQIPVTRVYISDFINFSIGYDPMVVTDGIAASDKFPTYPSLIRELDDLPLEPIIRTNLNPSSLGWFFETTSLVEDPGLWIYGHAPYRDSTSFVLNMDDPELGNIFPKELSQCSSMYDFKLLVGNRFDELYAKLDATLRSLAVVAPEKMRVSTNGSGKSTFIVDIPTFFGSNNIYLFDLSYMGWTFDKIHINKYFVGGAVIQTSFSVLGDSKTLMYCPDFASDFGHSKQPNIEGEEPFDMGGVSFRYIPADSYGFRSELSYIYNDYVFKELTKQAPENIVVAVDKATGDSLVIEDDADETKWINYTHTGYLLYEKDLGPITIGATEADIGKAVALEDGHILITINLEEISNAIAPWYPENIYSVNDKGVRSDFIVVEHGASGRLLPNQILVYPEDIQNYNGFCSYGDFFVINNLYNFKKRSFGQGAPEGYTVLVEFEDQNVLDSGVLSTDGSDYVLKKFQSTLNISVVFKGRTGRELGETKTKMITWVRQPMCPDVEIKYEWKARYNLYQNIPDCRCHGEYTPNLIGQKNYSRMPRCGDHDLMDFVGRWSQWNGNPKIGPMWWPYNSCEQYQAYEEITSGPASAIEIMAEFLEKEEGSYVHGQHDLRMLGPNANYGYEDGWCPMPSWCSCGMPTFNAKKVSDNDFIGYANYRSGVSAFQLKLWQLLEEKLPKFGNASRPMFRSYRSTDKVQFYYEDIERGLVRTWQWLPIFMYYTNVDITSKNTGMFIDYTSAYSKSTVNPMGFFIANSTIEDININETIDYINRYRFEDIFRTQAKGVGASIVYPKCTSSYGRTATPWLEYMPYPADSSKTIHWAWRDIWHPIKRRFGIPTPDLIDSFVNNDDLIGPFVYTGKSGNQYALGYLMCFNLSYPDYKYDHALMEHRLVCNEGIHYLNFEAPKKDEHTGEYLTLGSIQLDNGPKKYFDITIGNWLSPIDQGPYIYDVCSQIPWYNDVNLYSEESNIEPDEDRTFKEDMGYDYTTKLITYRDRYYNRGLHVTLISSLMKFLPARIAEVNQFNAFVYPSVWYKDEETNNFINQQNGDLIIIFDFDEIKRSIIKLELECLFGYTRGKEPTDEDKNKGAKREDYVYHWPAFECYVPVDDIYGSGWELLYEQPKMKLATKNSEDAKLVKKVYTLDPNTYYLVKGRNKVVIVFRTEPDFEEIDASNFTREDVSKTIKDKVLLSDIKIYDHRFINGKEVISTKERKFYVSYGDFGDEPPQGDGTKDGLLSIAQKEWSTVWQLDHRQGVMDVNYKAVPDTDKEKTYINKCRGRFVYDIQPEYEPVSGNVLFKEEQQKRLYDLAISKGNTKFDMVSIPIPGLRKYLDDADVNFYIEGLKFSLENTIVMPLADIYHPEPYNPGGHLYLPIPVSPTYCGNETFTYQYVAVTADGKIDASSLTAVMTGDSYLRGLTTMTINKDQRHSVTGYLKNFNEVTRYNMGMFYLDERLFYMGYLLNYVYPKYFSRYTKPQSFATPITSLTLGPPIRPFKYFPASKDGYYEGYNQELENFNLYGGWWGRYMGPNYSEPDPQPEINPLTDNNDFPVPGPWG